MATAVLAGALPDYRKLTGTPEAINPVHGWSAIGFRHGELRDQCFFAPIYMSVAAIDDSVRDKDDGYFTCAYPQPIFDEIRQMMSAEWKTDLVVSLAVV
jgi:hypothetical protein